MADEEKTEETPAAEAAADAGVRRSGRDERTDCLCGGPRRPRLRLPTPRLRPGETEAVAAPAEACCSGRAGCSCRAAVLLTPKERKVAIKTRKAAKVGPRCGAHRRSVRPSVTRSVPRRPPSAVPVARRRAPSGRPARTSAPPPRRVSTRPAAEDASGRRRLRQGRQDHHRAHRRRSPSPQVPEDRAHLQHAARPR